MLAFVLAALLFLTITGMALASFAVTSSKASTTYVKVSERLREIDGVLEFAAQTWRNDDEIRLLDTCEQDSAGQPVAITRDGYTATCFDAPGVAWTPELRVMDIEVEEVSSGAVLGTARVRVVDVVNNVSVLGYSLEVCDWLLGTSNVKHGLRGCST